MSYGSEQDLCCPICREVFRDPVFLLCSHSFCRDCLQTWWSITPAQQCPVCKKISVVRDLPSNLVLKNLCETFLLERERRTSEQLCSLHRENLKLFCLDHQEPVCLVCRDSAMHNNHRFRPVEEAAISQRKALQKLLKPLKEKLKLLEEVKEEFHQTIEYNKVQADNTEQQIKKLFQTVRLFLEQDEEARISSLREEEQRKRRLMEEKLEALSRDMADLSQTIASCEEKLRAANHVSFLQSCKAAVQRVQRCPLPEEPPLPSHALIDQAQHLGNLAFNIWSSMKDAVCYTPLVLDPNTAHPELILNEDLSSVRRGERQKVPRNPERFNYHGIVLGSRGLDSGTHSWVVEVLNNQSWGVGVTERCGLRNGSKLARFWQVSLSGGRFRAQQSEAEWSGMTLFKPPTEVLLNEGKLERIRVHLDWDSSRLSFFDANTERLIHTFKHSFTEKLFPFIHVLDDEPVRILPESVSVRVKEFRVPLTGFGWFFSSLGKQTKH